MRKVRPAINISSDIANRLLNRVQVVPMTSNISRVFASEALVHLGGSTSKAMADQITTATKERLGDRLGRLTAEDMAEVEGAIRRQLGLQGR
ncbi:MAG: type II toxin-antitoxin system PemK/MazF family toxin [Chloroflexota bacterium]|nr:type II toxin-antitoxin system PemK/MazF family toxin [Chloroflexota bacterium]